MNSGQPTNNPFGSIAAGQTRTADFGTTLEIDTLHRPTNCGSGDEAVMIR
jgi:hypothetical protein